MKTAEEILRSCFAEGEFDEIMNECLNTSIEPSIIQAMNLFAKSVAQQALENASESAGLIWNLAIGPYGGEVMLPEIDKSSITNHDNIPTI